MDEAAPLTCAACLRVTVGPQPRKGFHLCPNEGCYGQIRENWLGRLLRRLT